MSRHRIVGAVLAAGALTVAIEIIRTEDFSAYVAIVPAFLAGMIVSAMIFGEFD